MIKPEKLVVNSILCWAHQNKIWLEVYDSKGTYSESAKRYTKNLGMKSGTPDVLGVNRDGIMIAIEVKAPGKEKVARLGQLQFLLRLIDNNGFGCVSSSVDHLSNLYLKWISLSKVDDKKTLLLNDLPKKALINGRVVNFSP